MIGIFSPECEQANQDTESSVTDPSKFGEYRASRALDPVIWPYIVLPYTLELLHKISLGT